MRTKKTVKKSLKSRNIIKAWLKVKHTTTTRQFRKSHMKVMVECFNKEPYDHDEIEVYLGRKEFFEQLKGQPWISQLMQRNKALKESQATRNYKQARGRYTKQLTTTKTQKNI